MSHLEIVGALAPLHLKSMTFDSGAAEVVPLIVSRAQEEDADNLLTQIVSELIGQERTCASKALTLAAVRED